MKFIFQFMILALCSCSSSSEMKKEEINNNEAVSVKAMSTKKTSTNSAKINSTNNVIQKEFLAVIDNDQNAEKVKVCISKYDLTEFKKIGAKIYFVKLNSNIDEEKISLITSECKHLKSFEPNRKIKLVNPVLKKPKSIKVK